MNEASAINSTESPIESGETVVDEGRLLHAVEAYLRPDDVAHVRRVLAFAHEIYDLRHTTTPTAAGKPDGGLPARPSRRWDLDYVISVALTLADAIHVDAISLAAVLL